MALTAGPEDPHALAWPPSLRTETRVVAITDGARVLVTSGMPVLVLPVASRVNTEYAYSVLTISPASVTEVAVAAGRTTATPSPAVAGAVPPTARRTITAARSASPGLVHARVMLVAVRPTIANPVTTPGAVTSGAVGGVGGGTTGGIGGVGMNRYAFVVTDRYPGRAYTFTRYLPAFTLNARVSVAPWVRYTPTVRHLDPDLRCSLIFQCFDFGRSGLTSTTSFRVLVNTTVGFALAFFLAIGATTAARLTGTAVTTWGAGPTDPTPVPATGGTLTSPATTTPASNAPNPDLKPRTTNTSRTSDRPGRSKAAPRTQITLLSPRPARQSPTTSRPSGTRLAGTVIENGLQLRVRGRRVRPAPQQRPRRAVPSPQHSTDAAYPCRQVMPADTTGVQWGSSDSWVGRATRRWAD